MKRRIKTVLQRCFYLIMLTLLTTAHDVFWSNLKTTEPCMSKTSVETNQADRARAEAQLIICWIAALPGVCYMREWTEKLGLFPPSLSYKFLSLFRAEEFQELAEAQTIGNVPLWPSWRKEKKIVIRRFALEADWTVVQEGWWKRPKQGL